MVKHIASYLEVVPKNMKYYNIKLEVMLRILARNKKSAKAQAKVCFNNINWVYMKDLDATRLKPKNELKVVD